MKDFYEVLGVSRDASQQEIKRAYHKLARKLHPDRAGAQSEEAFKEVSVAYETLSDPARRRKYDMGGTNSFEGESFGFSDLFETFFSAATSQSGPVPRGRRGQDSLSVISLSLEEVAFGTTKKVSVHTANLCPTCEGSCCKPGTSPRTCESCGGRGSVQRAVRSFLGEMVTSAPCPACSGYGNIIPDPCPECSGEGRVRATKDVNVDIPAGVSHGTRIRMSGKGEVGPGGGPAGDLYFEIHERPHKVFVREGDDLHTTIRLPMTSAALGTKFSLETLDGNEEIEVAPGTQPNEQLTLRSRGITHLHRNSRGNLYVHIEVEVPRNLSERQTELLREFAGDRHEDSFTPVHRNEGGVFSRLRDKFAGR